jgi:hypothetical protein
MSIHQIETMNVGAYVPRFETLEGRQHIVVPCTLLVEGVHHGSAGPVYYSPEAIAETAQFWNGMSVPIYHPEVNGEYVSANTPEVHEEWVVGRCFRARYNTQKKALQAELWIDVARCEEKDPQLMARLQSGDHVEVSTGLTFEIMAGSGTWNNETYEMVAGNFHPDHLAILPGTQGACSLADGCGIRANQKGNTMSLTEKMKRGFARLQEKMTGFMEASFEARHRALQSLLDEMDVVSGPGPNKLHYLVETFDSTFIMRVDTNGEPDKYFRGSYTTDNDGNPNAIGESFSEVRKQTEWVAAQANKSCGCPQQEPAPEANTDEAPNTHVEDTNMKTKEKLVQGLIDNEATQFSEADRDDLMALSEEMLDKFSPAVAEADEGAPEGTEPTGNVDEAAGEDAPADTAPEANEDEMAVFIESAPESIRGKLKDAMAQADDVRVKYIDALEAHEKCAFTRAQLEAKDTEELRVLTGMLPEAEEAPADAGNGVNANADEGEADADTPMGRPSINMYYVKTATPSANAEDDAPMGRPDINTQAGIDPAGNDK